MNYLIFSCDSYKAAISAQMMELKKKFGRTYSYEKMAEACRIQKSYISKVLRDEKTHFTADQLFLVAQYLNLSKSETQFLELLMARDRSASKERRVTLEQDIKKIRQQNMRTEENINNVRKVPLSEEIDLASFFLDPDAQLVHVCLSIEKLARSLQLLAKVTGLGDSRVQRTIKKLKDLGLVYESHGQLCVKELAMHLTKDSPYFVAYRQLVRLKILERINALSVDSSYNVSVFFAGDARLQEEIQAEFLLFLKKIRAKVDDCKKPESVFQLTFDLVPWTTGELT